MAVLFFLYLGPGQRQGMFGLGWIEEKGLLRRQCRVRLIFRFGDPCLIELQVAQVVLGSFISLSRIHP